MVMDQEVIFSVHQNRRPLTSRRRTRSTGSLPWGKFSGDSSSSVGEWELSRELGMSSIQQSDSDDVSSMQKKRGLFNLQPNHLRRFFHSIESDSVNENFSPSRPATRRKRKLKRMAVDGDVTVTSVASTSRLVHSCQSSKALFGSKKKRIIRHGSNCENRYCIGGTSGKRKRSSFHDPPRTVLALHRLSLNDSRNTRSSSSISSSDSDPGIYTDEGREGDDEQSDWVYEASDRGAEGSDQRSLYLSDPLTARLKSLRSSIKCFFHHSVNGDREIRGGRRRLHGEKTGLPVLRSNEALHQPLRGRDITPPVASYPEDGPATLLTCGSSSVDPKRRRCIGFDSRECKSASETEPMDEGDPSAT